MNRSFNYRSLQHYGSFSRYLTTEKGKLKSALKRDKSSLSADELLIATQAAKEVYESRRPILPGPPSLQVEWYKASMLLLRGAVPTARSFVSAKMMFIEFCLKNIHS